MTATRRWCLVALGVLVLVLAPWSVNRLLPADAAPIGAADLLARAQAAHDRPYSGEVQTLGTLGLPLTDRFTAVSDLFGQRTTMRVWWRTPDDWRVDQLTTTGETDLIHDAIGTTSWDFESNRATRTGIQAVRLPQASDLLPPALAGLLLESARPDDVTRVASRRIAGIAAPGLRLTPRDPQTSIARVDVWIEPRTGLPLKVDVYAAGARNAALSSAFATVSITEPATSTTAFYLAPGARYRFDEVGDLAAAANAFAPVIAPDRLIGLDRRNVTTGAVGVYGGGVKLLIAIPLPRRIADPLRAQLILTPGATPGAGPGTAGVALGDPPLNLLLTDGSGDGRSWLLAGTLTPAALAAAADEVVHEQLPRNPQAARP